jgi:YHS domain-containing protein
MKNKMYRLLWILILVGIVYWLAKRAFSPGRRKVTGSEEAGEEMVQDPVCGCYLPKSQALYLSSKGKKIYFCSEGCFQKYKSSNALPKS